MYNPFVPMAFLTMVSFILLTIVTFSTPFNRNLYFLHSSVSGGVKFGGWGFCLDHGACSSTHLGYTWEPDFLSGLTSTLIFYPISALLCLLSWLALMPSLFSIGTRVYPIPVFTWLAWLTSMISLLAFILMIAIFSAAKTQFEHDGNSATFGPLPWLSLVATILMSAISFHATHTSPTNVYNDPWC